MKISLNWIKEFVDLNGISEEEIIKRITLSTAEIEGVEHKGKNVNGIIVARIESIENHPKSQKLHLLKVNTGKEILDVVCGAPNARAGLVTAFATIGANVNGLEIQKAIVGGFESNGMCCSGKELGISDNNDGIMELDPGFILGTDLKDIFQIDDTIIEIDNKSLSNRPDLWGQYGFAREISAIFKRELKKPEIMDLTQFNTLPKVDINIESKDCLRYSCIKAGNITKKVSPVNMQIRLYYCGMRSLSLLADLTNYIMLELGQPMHAFDGEIVKGITVANALEGEKFTTLDNKERTLNASALMIKNQDKTNVCVAGVMGGLDSEITENTTELLLESATFDAVCVRKTATALGLRSEASNRYEKSLDPELTPVALARYLLLLKNIDAGMVVKSSFSDNYAYHYPEIKIQITPKFIEDYCGIKLKENVVTETLKALQFKVEEVDSENLVVTVPSFRATKDVSIKADLVEEVSRIYGYDNILIQPLNATITPASQDFEHTFEYDAKYLLASNGLNEVSTYIWENKQLNKELNIDTKCHLKVINSLNKENDELRSELVPSMLEVIVDNLRTRDEIGIFEVARVITGVNEDNLAIENKNLCIALASKTKSEKDLYFEVKEYIENIVKINLNRELDYQLAQIEKSFVHPYNNACVVCNGVIIGYIGLIHPRTINVIDKKLNIAVVEIDFSKLAQIGKKDLAISKATKYQTVSLDFNFVMDKKYPYHLVKSVLSRFQSELDYTFELKDIFENQEVLGDDISYTFKYILSSQTHTLTGEEIEAFHSGLIKYAEKNGLKLRS